MRASYFVRDVVDKEYLVVLHLSGLDMVADALTKAVARSLFLKWAALLRDFALIATVLDEILPSSSLTSAH